MNSIQINGVSVITPTYHSAAMLRKTMYSIMQQNPALHFEWIVIAGDETEETKAVLDAYDRGEIVVEYRSPKGIYDAVRAGLSKARYDIVYWINAGDILMPYALDTVYEQAAQGDKSWWTGRASLRNEQGHLVRVDPMNPYENKLIKLGFYGKHMPWLQQESIFFRRHLLDQVDLDRFSRFRYAGDYFLFHSFASLGITLHSFDYVLASFTRHEGQASENQALYWKEVQSFAGSYSWNLVSHPVEVIRSILLVFRFFYKRTIPGY